MTRTVDLVIVGSDANALAAMIDAVGRGLHVLMVIRAKRPGLTRQLRRRLSNAGGLSPRQLTVMTGAEVACVDGVNTVEAVIVRRLGSRRLVAFNASGLVGRTEL